MASQKNLDIAYMKCAFAIAELSYAKRKKVGAILVSPSNQIIAEGCNGTPSGFDNNCETSEHEFDNLLQCKGCGYKMKVGCGPPPKCISRTKQECVHAESNCILKVARSTNSSTNGTLYTTLTPCFECSKLIIQAGIKRVVYGEEYPYPGHTGEKRNLGMELLCKANIEVEFLPLAKPQVPNQELSCEDKKIDPFDRTNC